MIDSQWRNVCTVIASVLLMLLVMVQVILSLALNLRSDMWTDSTDVVAERTRLVTGLNILIDALFIFPAAWMGICAAVSRHRGVYIGMTVIASLAFLGEIGGLVVIAYEFGSRNLFTDASSVNDELAISMLTMQGLVLLATIGLLIFAVIVLLYYSPDHPRNRYKSKEKLIDSMPPPNGAYMYPRAIGPQPAPAPSPTRYENTLADYRPLTRGSPEWDRFYEQYFANGARSYSGDDYRPKYKNRSNSYRY